MIIIDPPICPLILDMMMVFPHQNRSETHCLNSLFLTTSWVEVVDRKVTMNKHWTVGQKGYEVGRPKDDILGRTSKEDTAKNLKSFENPSQYNLPYFRSIGEDTLIHYAKWEKRERRTLYSKNVFESFLHRTVDLNAEWLAYLDHFCFDLLRVKPEAYELHRMGYYLQHGGAPQYWQSRFQEDCEGLPRIQQAARDIQAIIRPPLPNAGPVVDTQKELRDFMLKKENSFKKRLTRGKKRIS